MMTPMITHIEGRGLEIRGILIAWWVIWLLMLLFLLIIGFLALNLYKKAKKQRRT